MATQFGFVSTALGATETDETDLGTVTVPNGAHQITGICPVVVLQTATATEGTLAHARLTWSKAGQMEGIPTSIVNTEELGGSYVPTFMPVSGWAVAALTKIKCFATLTQAQTGTAHCMIYFRFE